ESFIVVLDVPDQGRNLGNIAHPGIGLAVDDFLQAAGDIRLVVDIRRYVRAVEYVPYRIIAEIALREYLFSCQVANRIYLFARDDMKLNVEHLGYKMNAVLDVGHGVFRLYEFQGVGHDKSHVDAAQAQNVDEILYGALAKDWQHAQIFAVVEHVGHVGA